MKKSGFFIMMVLGFTMSKAQANASDSLVAGTVQILVKDPRIDMLGKKMAEYNEALASRPGSIKMVRGFRLMVLSSTDRNQAMAIRSKLLQRYPDQKIYMTFQSPYIKMKLGNFADKNEAERYRKQVASSGIVDNNIYLVPEMVEIKVDKNAPVDE